MSDMIYEVHSFPNELLPFIFHKKCSATMQRRFFNWHENIEILFCTEGEGTVHCGGHDFPFCPEDIFVINPDTPHTLSSPTKVRYQCLIVAESFCIENGISTGAIHFRERICDPETAAYFRQVASAYNNMENSPEYAVPEIRLAVLRLLHNLFRYHSFRNPRPTSIEGIYVKKALQFIRSNLTSPLTLTQIADHAGISKFYLTRQFKRLTGNTVIRSINSMRCIYARQMLEKGMTVGEAAAASGFENASYFTRTFREHIGCLPSEIYQQTRSG